MNKATFKSKLNLYVYVYLEHRQYFHLTVNPPYLPNAPKQFLHFTGIPVINSLPPANRSTRICYFQVISQIRRTRLTSQISADQLQLRRNNKLLSQYCIRFSITISRIQTKTRWCAGDQNVVFFRLIVTKKVINKSGLFLQISQDFILSPKSVLILRNTRIRKASSCYKLK